MIENHPCHVANGGGNKRQGRGGSPNPLQCNGKGRSGLHKRSGEDWGRGLRARGRPLDFSSAAGQLGNLSVWRPARERSASVDLRTSAIVPLLWDADLRGNWTCDNREHRAVRGIENNGGGELLFVEVFFPFWFERGRSGLV